MEQFKHCPICTEVPEQEIYQCRAGHVICHLCISKVEQALCPPCRIPLGNNEIRCRVLEEILNSQDFECKFKERGCKHVIKRGDITTHTDSCDYNTELFPLCENLGLADCKYEGSLSKSALISHFQQVHGFSIFFEEDLITEASGESIYLLDGKRNSDSPPLPDSTRLAFLVSENDDEKCPLFLVYGNINKLDDSFSAVCFKVWESRTHPPEKYEVEISLRRKVSDGKSTPCPSESDSSNNPPVIRATDPFPITWTLRVYSVREASSILEECPVHVSARLLRKYGFGEKENSHDRLIVEIYPVD